MPTCFYAPLCRALALPLPLARRRRLLPLLTGRRPILRAALAFLLAAAIALAGALLPEPPPASAHAVTVISLGISDGPSNTNGYVTGDVITITANLSQRVTWTGSPQLPIQIGSQERIFEVTNCADVPACSPAPGTSGSDLIASSVNLIRFTYTVQHDDQDADGPSIAANAVMSGTFTFTHYGHANQNEFTTTLPDSITSSPQPAATSTVRVNPECASINPAIADHYTTGSETGKTTLTDTQMDNLVADCRALKLARTSLSRASDNSNPNWDTTATVNIANWNGVTFDNSTYRVTKVSFPDPGTGNPPVWNGFVSPNLGEMTALTEISFPNQWIQGAIPAALGDSATLQTINLNENPITSMFAPDAGDLPALQTLNLSQTYITSIPPNWAG